MGGYPGENIEKMIKSEWKTDNRTGVEIVVGLRKGYKDAMRGELKPDQPLIVGPKDAEILRNAGFTVKEFKGDK